MGEHTAALRKIIHVDMDAFYAAVEARDNPALADKPLIIGALPGERGVVCTCSYEARKFGVRSAMSITEAHRRCPDGVYMRPNMSKYAETSSQFRKIWAYYTDLCEYLSLDEGYLDITGSAHQFGGARQIAYEIKRRTKEQTGLTCSVGVGYSMMSAKLASEEKKPDGFFEILTPQALRELIADRSVRVIYGVGVKTAEQLQRIGIITVRDVCVNPQKVISSLGNQGRQVVELANGIDPRVVNPHSEPKSIGTEHTFQKDIRNFGYLKDVLLLIARDVSFNIRLKELYCRTVTLKVTYGNMKSITRSKSGEPTDNATIIYETAAAMLDNIERRPIRLIGITLGGLTSDFSAQLSLFSPAKDDTQRNKLSDATLKLQLKHGRDIVMAANELRAGKRVKSDYDGVSLRE